MTDKELIKALKHLAVQTGSLACLGCGHEHSCSIHGCAVIQEAIEALEEKKSAEQMFREQGYEKASYSQPQMIIYVKPNTEGYFRSVVVNAYKGVYARYKEKNMRKCREGALTKKEILACAKLIREMETANVTEE